MLNPYDLVYLLKGHARDNQMSLIGQLEAHQTPFYCQ